MPDCIEVEDKPEVKVVALTTGPTFELFCISNVVASLKRGEREERRRMVVKKKIFPTPLLGDMNLPHVCVLRGFVEPVARNYTSNITMTRVRCQRLTSHSVKAEYLEIISEERKQ